jgi:hypothetical protein
VSITDDPELKRLLRWQEKLDALEAKFAELEQALERNRALTLATRTGVPREHEENSVVGSPDGRKVH